MLGGEVYAPEARWRKQRDGAESPWFRAPATSSHRWWRPSWAFLACGRRRCRGPGSCARSREPPERSLTLVSAPPGYGKTTAVRAWCASRARPSAWVTLDTRDNDPNRMWRYVATAVDGIRGGLGRGALQRLPRTGGSIESAIDELTNALASYGEECVIVLDDAHTVTDPDCLACLDYFVEHLPDAARLVLITRSDPPLRLARLRSRRALVELRADELAFTSAEARSLLVDGAGLTLEPQEVETLRSRTEGWPAALVLAAIWLDSVADPSGGDSRVRRQPGLRRRLPHPGGAAVARPRHASVSAANLRPRALHGGDVRRSARSLRFGGRAGTARARELPRHAARAGALVPDSLALRRVRRLRAGRDRPRRRTRAQPTRGRMAAMRSAVRSRPRNTRRGQASTSSSRVCWPSITSS